MKDTILLCGDIANSIKNILKDNYNIEKINNLSLITKESHTPLAYQLVIIDKDIMLKTKFRQYGLPLLAIAENAKYEEKLKIFSHNAKGTLELSNGKKYVLTKIQHCINFSNPYINTFRDHFVKSFLKYEALKSTMSSVLYLCNYLIYHFKIDNRLAADIRLAVIFLTIGYEKGNLLRIKHLIQDMNISEKVTELFQNYEVPKNIEEAIVFCAMSVNFKNINATEVFLKMGTGDLKNIFKVAHESLANNIIIIEKSYDIDIFWERVSEILFSDKRLTYLDNTNRITTLYKTILRLLVLHGMLEIKLEHIQNIGYEITIAMLEKGSLDAFEYKSFYEALNENLDLSKCYDENCNNFHIKFAYEESEHKAIENKKIIAEPINDEIKYQSTVDKNEINTLHFEDSQKLSAVQFVKEYGVDHDLLADMNESSMDTIESMLSVSNLSRDISEKIANTFEFYAKILHRTLEFDELAHALSTLSRLMIAVDLTKINEIQIETLKQYTIGILEDLNEWSDHIYVLQDTNDIHYLDASLLENASQIERFTNPDIEEVDDDDDDDDDLEFF